jgi:hypothetical protein
MRPLTLQALAWTTVAAAVGSALWLAAAESNYDAPGAASSAGRFAAGTPRATGGRVLQVSLPVSPRNRGAVRAELPAQPEPR